MRVLDQINHNFYIANNIFTFDANLKIIKKIFRLETKFLYWKQTFQFRDKAFKLENTFLDEKRDFQIRNTTFIFETIFLHWKQILRLEIRF